MEFLSTVLAGVTGILEFEGRRLRDGALGTARAVAWIALAAVAAAFGLALFLYGVFLEGSRLLGPGLGAFAASGVALAISATVALSRRTRPGR